MLWIQDYQLFLFDFDGILVNSEELHYKAYIEMCANRGFNLNWDEKTYIRHAMYSAAGLRKAIYQKFPDLERYEPCWEILYQEKKQAYRSLLCERGIGLMPGVEELLLALENRGIKRCVVTHSSADQTEIIRRQHPILNSIPNWITREDYQRPKPDSECYLKAISLLKDPHDRVVGFEDSPRGLKALLDSGAEGVFISNYFSGLEIQNLSCELGRSFTHARSFPEFFRSCT